MFRQISLPFFFFFFFFFFNSYCLGKDALTKRPKKNLLNHVYAVFQSVYKQKQQQQQNINNETTPTHTTINLYLKNEVE